MRRALALVIVLAACGGDAPRPCDDPSGLASLPTVDCFIEFTVLADRPLDAALPGAFTVKILIDQADGDAVYFTDTEAYPLHSGFAVEHLGWPPGLDFFTEYLYPQRRFLLGAITWYQEPGIWAFEMAPYDTASPEMVAKAYRLLAAASYFGELLRYHPTSQEQLARAAELPAGVPWVTTDDIYQGISYQPLNLGETIGTLRVLSIDDLETEYVGPRDLVVLDRVPNDIAVVAGVVTAEFQTPLSHVNVLSQQRGTPNMALRDAAAELGGFEGKWVRLQVGAFDWAAAEVTADQADQWWDEHRPPAVDVTPPDYGPSELIDVDDLSLADVAVVGGKAAHFGELRDIPDLPVRDGFAIPVFYYRQFVEQNGFDAEISAMLADERFRADGLYRRDQLAALQAAMLAAPVDADLLTAIEARVVADFDGVRMRFRSSTNAEDLEGHSGAGLYTSASGEIGSAERPIAGALRTVWASLWNFRAYEEREYAGIGHGEVAMAMLVHPAYLDEQANGVAITANPFDPGLGGEDGFYINAQVWDVSVVRPPDPSITADQLLYYYGYNGQPATYYTHSSLITEGETVLSRRELFDLGTALAAIRDHFESIYAKPNGFAALPMDVEFEVVLVDGERRVEVKQARPWPGRGA